MFSAKRSASIFESRSGLPCSLVSSWATSSRCSRTWATACIKICARLLLGVLLQAGNAAAAAAIARRVSAASPFGTLSTTSRVAGLRTSVVAPLAALTRSPLMNIWAKATPSKGTDDTVGGMSETAAAQSFVSVSREPDGVALIHLHRPPANSYNRAFLDELNAAIDEVRWDGDVHGAVLVSDLAPRFFSAGADITNFANSTQAHRVMTVLHAQEILLKIERTPKVFIAAISGHALGGGLEIALACDFRFAAEGEFRLGLPEVTLGLLPGNGGTQRLSRLIGRTRALDMMITNQQVNSARALELGLVERVFPADELVEKSVDYVAQLAKGPTLAIGNIKIATRLGADLPMEGALALEREAVWRLFMSADATEGLAAFGAKRAPNWTGQ